MEIFGVRVVTSSIIPSIKDFATTMSAIKERVIASITNTRILRLGDIAKITNGDGDVQDASDKHNEGWYPFFDRSTELKWFPTYSFDDEAIIYSGEGQSFMPRYYKGKFALHQRCYAITNFRDGIIPRYCFHMMGALNHYFLRNAVGSTVPSLRMDIFQRAKIIVPTISEQRRVCQVIDAISSKLELAQRLLSQLELVRKHLLSGMFI